MQTVSFNGKDGRDVIKRIMIKKFLQRKKVHDYRYYDQATLIVDDYVSDKT